MFKIKTFSNTKFDRFHFVRHKNNKVKNNVKGYKGSEYV